MLLEKRNKFFFSILVLVPICFFYTSLFNYTCNIPINDDFDVPINSILKIFQSHNLLNQLKFIFEFHFDHRVVFLRLESIFSILIFKKLNFHSLNFFNSLLLIPFFYFMVLPLLKKQKYIEASTIAFGLFIYSFEDCVFWLHISSNYFPTIFFAALSMYFAATKLNTLKNVFFVFSFSVLTLLCFGNGFLVFISVALIFLLKKSYKLFVIWLIISISVIKAYFLGYQNLEERKYFSFLFIKVKSFLCLIGSFNIFSNFNSNLYLGIILICAISGIVLYAFYNKKIFEENNLFYLGLICFFGGTLFVIVLGRITGESEEHQIESVRYRFYSVMLFSAFIAFYFNLFNLKKFYAYLVLFVFITFNIFTFIFNLSNIDFYSKSLYSSAFNWRNSRKGLIYFHNNQNFAISKLNQLMDLGLYQPPICILDSILITKISNVEYQGIKIKQINNNSSLLDYVRQNKAIVISELNFNQNTHGLLGCYFMLKSKNNSLLFPCYPNIHRGRNLLKFGIGGSCEIYEDILEKEEYQILVVLIKKNNIIEIHKTKEKIIIS